MKQSQNTQKAVANDLVAVDNSKRFTKGFNLGSIFIFIAYQFGKQDKIPKELFDKFKKYISEELFRVTRFSGTMSNYMTLKQRGYGEHKDLWSIWQVLTGKLTFAEKLKYIRFFPTKNVTGLVDMLSKFVDKSFLYNFVDTVKQLGIKEVEFTFNSLGAFLGFNSLQDSLDALKFVKENTNLTRLELVNESYFDKRIIGLDSRKQQSYQKTKEFTDYLYSIIPEIVKITGKETPIGLNVAHHNGPKFVGHNRAFVELADKLIEEGYNVYIVPHIYFSSYDLEVIESEIKSYCYPFLGKYEVRFTEFNVDPKVPFPNGRKLTQEESNIFFDKILKIFQKLGVSGAFIHSLWELDDTHFSYIKKQLIKTIN